MREMSCMDVARENTPGKLQMLVLERRDEGCNMARFYVLAIEPTLFGDTALIREWARIGANAPAPPRSSRRSSCRR